MATSNPPVHSKHKLKKGSRVLVEVETCDTTSSFLWVIKDLVNSPFGNDVAVRSCEFRMQGYPKSIWCLMLRNDCECTMDISLILLASDKDLLACVKLCLLDLEFNEVQECRKSHLFQPKRDSTITFSNFVSQKEILKKSMSLLNDGDLILFGEISILDDEIQQCSPSIPVNSRFQQDTSMLLQTKLFYDFIIDVQGVEFPCHKAMLSCRSQFFNALLNTDMREKKENKLVIKDTEPHVFQKLMCYIYTGEVQILESDVFHLLAAADKYLLEGLKILCEEKLNSLFSFANASRIYLIANIFSLHNLKLRALRVLGAFTMQIQKVGGWEMLRPCNCYSRKHQYTELICDICCETKNIRDSLKYEEVKLETISSTNSMAAQLSLKPVDKKAFPPTAEIWCYTDNHVFLKTIWRVKALSDSSEKKLNRVRCSYVFSDKRNKLSCRMEISTSEGSKQNLVGRVHFYLTLLLCDEDTLCFEFRFSILNTHNEDTNVITGVHNFKLGERYEVFQIAVHDILGKRLLHKGDLLLNCKCLCRKSFVHDWNLLTLPNDVLINDVATLKDDDNFTDFVVRSRKVEFRCHKALLACRSPYFCQRLKCSSESALEVDVDPGIFKRILSYIYSDEYEQINKEAWDVLPLACQFELKHLKSICENVLISDLNVDNALQTLEFSVTHGAFRLQKYTSRFIGEFWNEILEIPTSNALINDGDLLADILNDRMVRIVPSSQQLFLTFS